MSSSGHNAGVGNRALASRIASEHRPGGAYAQRLKEWETRLEKRIDNFNAGKTPEKHRETERLFIESEQNKFIQAATSWRARFGKSEP